MRISSIFASRHLSLNRDYHTIEAGINVWPVGTPRWQAHHHVSADLDIVVVVEGAGWFQEHDGDRLSVTQGMAFLRRPGVVHSNQCAPELPYIECYVRLPGLLAVPLLASGLVTWSTPVAAIGCDAGMVRRIDRLARRLKDSSLSTAPLLSEVFALAVELLERGRAAQSQRPMERAIIEARAILADASEPGRRMDALAHQLGVGYPGFRKAFVLATGESPGAYRQRCRLEQARRLLLGGITVTHVAQTLGYPAPQAFIRLFQRTHGITPGAFAAQARQIQP